MVLVLHTYNIRGVLTSRYTCCKQLLCVNKPKMVIVNDKIEGSSNLLAIRKQDHFF